MSSVSKREGQLILDLLLHRVSEEDFYREFPSKPDEANELGLAMLRRAAGERDPVGVEYGLYLGHRFGITRSYLDVLLVLADADWHERHADVVDGLAKLREPVSVDVLYRAALVQHYYLEYDEAYSLGVKCIYALGDIQTPEAVDRLRKLLSSGNGVLESEAAAQLDDIEKTGKLEAVRIAARDALAVSRSRRIDCTVEPQDDERMEPKG
jgi:PBS lyase HEAT-like repeat